MKKIIVCIAAIIALSAQLVSGATIDFTVGSPKVNVLDGAVSVKETDVVPVDIEGEYLIPLRITAESLGATVLWDDIQRSVTVTTGEKLALIENPVIMDNRTMVTTDFLSNSLGYNVRYIKEIKQIIISNDTPVMRVNDDYIYYDEVKLLYDIDKDKYVGEEELLVKSCISSLYDTAIMCSNLSVKDFNLTDDKVAEILSKSNEFDKEYSLKSIYTYILKRRALADVFSDYLSNLSIPSDDEIMKYFNEASDASEITDEEYEEIKYLLGYEKFVEFWNVLYNDTREEWFYEMKDLTEMLK